MQFKRDLLCENEKKCKSRKKCENFQARSENDTLNKTCKTYVTRFEENMQKWKILYVENEGGNLTLLIQRGGGGQVKPPKVFLDNFG